MPTDTSQLAIAGIWTEIQTDARRSRVHHADQLQRLSRTDRGDRRLNPKKQTLNLTPDKQSGFRAARKIDDSTP